MPPGPPGQRELPDQRVLWVCKVFVGPWGQQGLQVPRASLAQRAHQAAQEQRVLPVLWVRQG